MSLCLALTIACIVIGSSFQFGYHTGVVNAPLSLIENFINYTSADRGNELPPSTIALLSSLIVAAFPVGGIVGALSAGWLATRLGRKRTLLVTSVPTIIGSLLMGLSKATSSYEMIIVGRLIIGVACGIYTGLAPLYLSEIAPLRIRGASGTINQLVIVTAILVSQLMGLPQALSRPDTWPYLLGFSLVPCLIQLIGLPFCPESPSFLMLTKKDEAAARSALVKLRASDDVENEIAEMAREADAKQSVASLSILDLFRRPHLRCAILVGIGLHLSQQLSGVAAVLNYSSKIFAFIKLSVDQSIYATTGLGLTMVAFTLVSLAFVDRLGRRTLQLVGLAGMFLFSVLLTASLLASIEYMAVASVYLYLAFFAIGPGAIPWFIIAEMFTQESRDSAVTVAIVVNWIAQIAVGIGYPQLLEYTNSYSFIPFAAILLAAVIFTYFLVPETKGRPAQEIEALFLSRIGADTGRYASFSVAEKPGLSEVNLAQ